MKIKLYILLISIWIFFPFVSNAANVKDVYPRLANYFLKWEISDQEAVDLAKWDLLILDMEVKENSPDALEIIKKNNPDIIILAYITSQEIIDDINQAAGYTGAFLRRELRGEIVEGWWLKDSRGNKISNWQGTYMLNLSNGSGVNNKGQRFNDYLPYFIAEKIGRSSYFDGVFYDNTWGDISWVNNGDIDLDNDGQKDNKAIADQLWIEGFNKILNKTRDLLGNDFIIVGNGRVYQDYQRLLNGMMLESFPSSWENGGTWSGSMNTYLKLPTWNKAPQLPIINVNVKNQTNYQAFRFGLTSTLLGNGFYSFDYDFTNHSQAWWYDEYNINLGPAISLAKNISNKNSLEIEPGLWRRDFKLGSVFVNSTNKEQTYIFSQENLEKIKGTQDKIINTGEKTSSIKLAPRDGIILLNTSDNILNSPFINGYFYRSFNQYGDFFKGGFFAYSNTYPASSHAVTINGEKDKLISLVADKGRITLSTNGENLNYFYPYNDLFRQAININTSINNGDLDLVVTGPTQGGGPQVRVFRSNGQLLNSFFAYDKNSRGGVSVAIGDLENDKILEVVTGPGKGQEPLVKIFTLDGQLKSSFLAYDRKFIGGIEVAVGDVNSDGLAEIITAPGPGGGPQIRIFNAYGRSLSQFFAYDKNYRLGMDLTLSDLDCDGNLEILTGVKNVY